MNKKLSELWDFLLFLCGIAFIATYVPALLGMLLRWMWICFMAGWATWDAGKVGE